MILTLALSAVAVIAVIVAAVFAISNYRTRDLIAHLRLSAAVADEAIEGRYNVLEAVPGGIYILDAADRFSHVNEEAERLMHVAPGELVGRAITEIVDPLASDLLPEIRQARESGQPVSRVAYFAATGWWVEIRIKPGGRETVVSLRDVTMRKSAEARLLESESRLRMLMSQVPAVLWSVDRLGRFVSLSGAGLGSLDLREDEWIGKSCGEFIGSNDAVPTLVSVFGGEPVQCESARGKKWLRHHIEPLRGNGDAVIGAVGVTLDITELKASREKLEEAAHRDALTGLPNRFTIDRIWRDREHVGVRAVLFVDLDRFKAINDTLGHKVGDQVLRIIADRLREAVNESDVVVRAGGDEFVVVVRSANSPDDVGTLATRILGRIADPITIGDRQFFISASVGAALSPQHGVSADDLITNADTAMYRAKSSGSGTFAYFDSSMQGGGYEPVALEADLRSALRDGALRVLYQPIVDLEHGHITGCEALVRWKHPVHGELQPEAFLHLAEQSGFIVDITRMVLRRACTVLAGIRDAHPEFRMTVNLSPRDLRDGDMISAVAEELLRARLQPESLEIEVTEHVVVDERSIMALQTFRDLGVGVALDDFGVAYNSLMYLKRLPLTALKIHENFVREIDDSRFDQAIVRAIVSLGNALGLRTISEGVESAAQAQTLRALGCQEAQGFRFSYPLEAHDLQLLLSEPPDYSQVGRTA
jgi:diguanylate cyclase (GGDEF)-like protein/PAS domain S-box-containing protein